VGTAGAVLQRDASGAATETTLKQLDAGLLNVGYAEAGPADGPVVLLLHGWPYDIHSYADVAPMLAAEGYRAIIPYLRGYGSTRFLSEDTFRNGQPSVLAVDAIALMNALDIGQASLPALTGEHARPTSSRHSGPSAAGRWSR
jgi:dienelactone hydrolase